MLARQRIVIIGGGFGGAYCAQELEKRLRPGHGADILLINPTNYFIFTPLLMEAGTGSLEPRHAVVSLRSFIKSSSFKMGRLTTLDIAHQQIEVQLSSSELKLTVPYDHLVLALGSVTNLPDVPGLIEYGYEMKSLSDAVALRDRAIHMLELAEAAGDPELSRRLLHFVVVGGNFSGVEVAGELHEYLQTASKVYPSLHPADCQVTLLERGDAILDPLGPELGSYAARKMQKRGIDIRFGETATSIEPERVILQSGEILDTDTVIWCAGVAPQSCLKHADLPSDNRGYILTERNLKVRGHDNVWAIGDCAVNHDPHGRAYPATAQHAVAQGKHLARNLAAVLQGAEPTDCNIMNRGSLAALGCRTGVARMFGIKISGFLAWWLWRTVYLLKMPGWWRRLRVALDWTLDLFTRRDVVQLSLHGTRRSTSRETEDQAAQAF